MTERELNGWAKPPLCVFCNAPWTDDMVEVEAWATVYCDTCGPELSHKEVTITCSSCKRVVYHKDYQV